MSLTHNLLALSTTTPTMLTATAAQEGDYGREVTISIQNLHSSNLVYLGSSTVTTSSYGFRLDPGSTFTATLKPEDEIYAVCSATTTNVGVIQVISRV